MMTVKLTKDNLRKASDHLFYEIWMMNQLASLLEGRNTSPFRSKPTGYTHTSMTASFSRGTGVIKISQGNVEEDETLRVTNNAFIEAFGIHVRALLDFFYSKAQDDDVVAAHFFESPGVWENSRP